LRITEKSSLQLQPANESVKWTFFHHFRGHIHFFLYSSWNSCIFSFSLSRIIIWNKLIF
jgi:hypothetical protein